MHEAETGRTSTAASGDDERLARLLRPRSIAVVGGGAAAEALRQCRRMNYPGRLYAVHPTRGEIAGAPAHARLSDLPEVPDAVFVGVNREATVDVVAELAAMGAGGAVCYASGFGEAGPYGQELQDGLAAAAGDMPVLGPNCYGLINYVDGALLWPDQHGGARRDDGVALVTQSGNIAINLTMTHGGLPLSYVVALGNQACVGMSELIPALAADSRVSAIGLLIEGIDDVAALVDGLAAARRAGVPVVALRAGQSAAGADLAMSHSASLGGSARFAAALFARHGVGEVHSLEVFVESLKLLHAAGPLPGGRVASMSSSGGEAILMADAARRQGVHLPAFAPDRRAAVEATVSDLVTVSNPLDYHTFMWGDAAAMTETFTAVMASEFDLTCLVLDLPRADRCDDSLWRPSLEALEAAQQRTGARAAWIASLPDGLPEDVAQRCLDRGIAPLIGLDNALAAMAVATDIGVRWRRPAPPSPLVASAAPKRPVRTSDEATGKARIAAAGVPVPDGRAVTAGDGGRAAADAARALGFPVAVKALGEELTHKSDVGGVALNLTEPDAVAAAADRMAGLCDRMLVERMVTDAIAEVIVGYQYDAKLGGFLLVGSGGELVELVGDSEVLPLPLADGDVSAALDRLRVIRLIDGYRGRARGDRAALEAAVAGIAQFCVEAVDTLAELDVNPLLVRPEGRGVAAADVLIRHTETEERVTP